MSSLKGGFITRSKSKSVSKPKRTGNKKSSSRSHQRKTKKMGLWGGSPTKGSKGSKGSTGSNSTSSSVRERRQRNPNKKQNPWRELFLQHVANKSVSPLSSLESEDSPIPSPPRHTILEDKSMSKYKFTNLYCLKKGISTEGQTLQNPQLLNQIDVAFKEYKETGYVPW